MLIAYADGHDTASVHPREIAPSSALLMGWTPRPVPWLVDAGTEPYPATTAMAGYSLAEAIHHRRIRYVPIRLSRVPRLLQTTHRPDVVVIPAVRRGSELAFDRSVGWAMAAAEQATSVVVEIDEHAPDAGGPLITVPVTRTVIGARALRPPPPNEITPIDEAIARNVGSILPARPTLQFGPGSVADAIVRGIDQPVSIWSGLLTDAVATLFARGLLADVAVGAYLYGGEPLIELGRAAGLRLTRIEETHDPARIASIERFVALNTALQVGLDGSVNVERVRGRLVAGIGGHSDFCAAASSSANGLSVIALRSTHGSSSTIVRTVETVSTPRADVDIIVTEHGIADLRGVDDGERAARIIAIAHPDHRRALEESPT